MRQHAAGDAYGRLASVFLAGTKARCFIARVAGRREVRANGVAAASVRRRVSLPAHDRDTRRRRAAFARRSFAA